MADNITTPIPTSTKFKTHDFGANGHGAAHVLFDSTEGEILGTKADAKNAATDTTAISFMSVWKQISASVQAVAALITGGYLLVHDNKGLSNLVFSATFTTLTRPANTTAYAAADSISDNATAGSVTALSATVSDTNDDPIFISEILVSSTDTGLAGKKLRAYLFNSDPTASSGVGAGDNSAYSQKKAGYIGSFMGWMETGFSDGTVGRLVPTFNETNNSPAGSFIATKPTSGAKTLYIQYQAVEVFAPSANSTSITGTARGWQGRAV